MNGGSWLWAAPSVTPIGTDAPSARTHSSAAEAAKEVLIETDVPSVEAVKEAMIEIDASVVEAAHEALAETHISSIEAAKEALNETNVSLVGAAEDALAEDYVLSAEAAKEALIETDVLSITAELESEDPQSKITTIFSRTIDSSNRLSPFSSKRGLRTTDLPPSEALCAYIAFSKASGCMIQSLMVHAV